MATKEEKTPNGTVGEETDVEHEVFKAHVRRSALASLPDVPEEMLPWLVGRFAANEVYQKTWNADIEARQKAQGEVLLDIQKQIGEVNQKAPGSRMKYGTLAIAATGVIGVVAQHFGVQLGPLMKALLSL